MHEEYLEPFELSEDIRTLIVESPCGSGKTTQMLKLLDVLKELQINFYKKKLTGALSVIRKKEYEFYIKNPIRALVISVRITQSKEVFVKYKDVLPDMCSYQDEDSEDWKKGWTSLVMSIESFWRLQWIIEDYDVVILDECKSIIDQFFSQHLRNGADTREIFLRILKDAKWAVAMDENIDENCLYLMTRYRKGKGRYLVNRYKNREGYIVKVIPDPMSNIKHLFEMYRHSYLKGNTECYQITCAMKDMALYIARNLHQIATGVDRMYDTDVAFNEETGICVICSDTKKRLSEDFFDDLNVTMKKVRVLIFTSTITVGIDIRKWADHAFAFFDTRTITHDIGLQMVNRSREISSKTLWCSVDRYRVFERVKLGEILSDLEETVKAKGKFPGQVYDELKDLGYSVGEVLNFRDVFVTFAVTRMQTRNLSHCYHLESVKHAFERSGWKFEKVGRDMKELGIEEEMDLKSDKKADGVQHVMTLEEALGSVSLITEDVYKQYKGVVKVKGIEIGLEQRAEMLKYEIHRIIKVSSWDDVKSEGALMHAVWKKRRQFKTFCEMRKSIASLSASERRKNIWSQLQSLKSLRRARSPGTLLS